MANPLARMTVIEALRVLGISPSQYEKLTKEKLRLIFRELVKRVHPDRGGDDHLFDLVQQAYEVVLASRRDFQVSVNPKAMEEKMRQEMMDRDYAPRRVPGSHHRVHPVPSSPHQVHPVHQVPSSTRDRPSYDPAGGERAKAIFSSGQNFNVQKFNEMFSDHYEADEDSKRNYNDFLKSNERVTRDIVIYEDPSEYQGSSSLSFSNIGGTNGSFTSKQYTDLYEAYTEQHPDEVQGRKEEYRTLDDVHQSRSRKIDLTAEDTERMRRISSMKQHHETVRQRRALDEDTRMHDRYNRLHFQLTHQ